MRETGGDFMQIYAAYYTVASSCERNVTSVCLSVRLSVTVQSFSNFSRARGAYST